MAITKVSSALIGANTIATSNIADNAVDGTKIADGNISTAKLADLSVTSGKLATNLDLAGTLDVTGATVLDSTLGVSGTLNVTGDGDDILINSDDYELLLLGNRGASGANLDKAYLRMKSEGTNTIALDVDGSSYFNGGNVGIGTTAPNQWSSYTDSAATVLQVQDTSQRARMVINGGNGAHLDMVDYAGGSNDKHMNYSVDGGIAKFGSLNDAGNAWVQENILIMDLGAGNVGIGTASPLSHLTFESDHWNTGTEDGPSIRWNNGITTADSLIQSFEDSNVAPFVFGMNSYIASGGSIAAFNSSYASSYIYQGASGNIVFGNATSGAAVARVTIDSAGKVSITAAGSMAMDVQGEGGSHGLAIGGNDGGFGYIGHRSSGSYDFQINSGGDVSIAATKKLYLDALGDTYITEDAANQMAFFTGGSKRFALIGGAGYFSGTVTASHNFSDERLKENIVVIPNALEKINTLRGITFTRKSDGSSGTGLIAQELEKVLPEAVYESKTMSDDDDTEYKAITYEVTVGLLVEGIKELKTKLEAAEARIKTLEDA